MKFRPLSIMLLGVLLTLSVSLSVAAPVPQTPEPPDEMPALSGGSLEEYPFDLKKVVGRSAASISAAGDTIDIAVSDVDDESTPKVALCAHNQYLVVYEKGAEIYGQRLDDDGDLLGSAFAISGDSYPEANPDVACEWIYNTFIVVWDHDYAGQHTNYDVRAQAVHGSHQTSGSQLRGNTIAVSQDQPQDERYPAIACNSNDNTCLVAFEYSDTGSGDIYGQRVYVGSSGYGTEGNRFSISTSPAEEHNPDVAWGGRDDDYLVLWQYLHNDPSDHYRIVTAYVWDTDQAGSQIETEVAWLIGPGSYDHNQTSPAAAYNRDAQRYLATFQYDYWGDGSDYDVYALRLVPGGGSQGSVFPVAETGDDEDSPVVAFSGGPEDLPGMGADQFLITYVQRGGAATVLRGQAIKGTHDAGGDQLGDSVEIRTTGSGINFGLFAPDVTGSVNNGQYLVVWEDMTGGLAGHDYDVLGRILSFDTSVYLPLVLNDYTSGFYFQPNPDGYSFPNYGNGSHYYQDDLGAGDLISMFGANKVCASGSTPADCVLTAAAEAWRQKVFSWMNGGHCEGMAVTSLRFFKGQTYYTGDTTPGDFQAGARTVYDLTRSQAIDNYIAYYFALQDVEEVWQPTEFIRENDTPKQQLEMVRQELRDGNDPYTLNVYDADLTVGHAIVPYDVQDRGGGFYRLYVYDNNAPGDDNRYITFDTNNDTWYYTATFAGNAGTKSLSLSRISLRTGEPFTCPFAASASAVEFFMTNGGNLLITNARGQRIGYDPATRQMVNEIPDAHVVYLRGVHVKYWIPLGEAGEVYSVTVSGANISAQVETDLVMVGPGYVVGFEGIQLQPSQTLRMSMSADGRQLVFDEGQATPSPQVFQAID
jgi:hypothetical protein